MVSPFDVQSNDLAVLFVTPQSETDARVPLVDSFRSWAKNEAQKHQSASMWKMGWKQSPSLIVTGALQLTVSGVAEVPLAKSPITIDSLEIALNPLANTSSTILNEEHLSLVVFASEVGAAQDEVLGQVSFQYQDPATEQLVAIQKENDRRLRVFWCIVRSPEALTSGSFMEVIPVVDGTPTITKTAIKVDYSNLSLYLADQNLLINKAYPLINEPLLIDILPMGLIYRRQNYTASGYTWGLNGESALETDYALSRIKRKYFQAESLNERIERRMYEIFSGIPGNGKTFTRAVKNLSAGSSSAILGLPGEPASSPNGSVALANGQRVSFTNQAISANLAVEVVTAGNDGQGNATCVFSLNSVPSGTRFSDRRSDHKIYNALGKEVSAKGRFQNLGLSGSLIWSAEGNPDISPGQIAYFQPTVLYPAGSGFNVAFDKVESVFVDGQPIPTADIREAYAEDLSAYETPTGTQNKIVVVGQERAALHYIYHNIAVSTTAGGVLAIPSAQKGCFAFVDGVSGRIDTPVVTGLSPNTSYNCLIYYPPRQTEVWQFQVKHCQYGGVTDTALIDGSRIIAPPRLFIHTQGGGASAFFGGSLKYIPISMHLPISSGSPAHYELNTPVGGSEDEFEVDLTLKEASLYAARSGGYGAVGDEITSVAVATSNPRSVSARLDSNGQTLSVQIQPVKRSSPIQAVLVIPVAKNDKEYLIVATKNLISGEMTLDASKGTAIDIFKV